MATTIQKSLWSTTLAVCLMCADLSALVIYRFGGESHPPPSELSAPGGEEVRFVQLRWTDLDPNLGGHVSRLDLDEQWIRAQEHDPEVNIAPSFRERGGRLGTIWRNGEKYSSAFDGDLSTAWMASRYLCSESVWGCDEYGRPGIFEIFLGDAFPIDRIKIVSGLADPSATVRNLRIELGEWSDRQWLVREDLEIRDNREQYRVIPISYDQPVSEIIFRLAEHDRPWEVGEVEVYAKGFVEKSTYVSDIIDFGELTAWGELRWSGFKNPGAELLIRTRSGTDADPDIHWKYTGRGNERIKVTGAQYDELGFGQKAGTTYDLDNWTFWSEAYNFADSTGTPVASLSPRRHLQFQVEMVPSGEASSGLDFLELRASTPPVASELLGEIFPFELQVGHASRFTYALKPTLKGHDTGFDHLRMKTSTGRLLAVDSLLVDKIAVPYEVESLDETHFEISFPKITREEDSGALIEVVFQAQVFRYGTTFSAWAFDSSRPLEVPQAVTAGDATLDFDGNTVSVATSLDNLSLLEISVLPRIFTPNGDGANDTAYIVYDLLESLGKLSVSIEIFDLAGRLICQIHTGEMEIGHYQREWDGTNQLGQRVPPGTYLYRVSVYADRDRFDKLGTLHVAY